MITVFGSINVDLVCRVARSPHPGETVRGSDYALIPGGKGANQALAARRAGRRGASHRHDRRRRHRQGRAPRARPGRRRSRRRRPPARHHRRRHHHRRRKRREHDRAVARRQCRDACWRRSRTALSRRAIRSSSRWKCRSPRICWWRERQRRPAPASCSRSRPSWRCRPEEVADVSMLVVNQHEAADFARHLGLSVGDAAATVEALAENSGGR